MFWKKVTCGRPSTSVTNAYIYLRKINNNNCKVYCESSKYLDVYLHCSILQQFWENLSPDGYMIEQFPFLRQSRQRCHVINKKISHIAELTVKWKPRVQVQTKISTFLFFVHQGNSIEKATKYFSSLKARHRVEPEPKK